MSLAFLTPALVGALALVAVPILVHLISRRRARRVRFGAIEFVLKSQRRTARSIRLRQLLLLLVRAALVAALALAVAQPVLRPEAQARVTEAPLVVVLALDTSASMHARLDGRTAFDRARDKAGAILDDLREDVRVAVVACADPVDDVLAPATFDRRAADAALSSLEAGYGTSDLAACAEHGARLASQVPGEGERRVVVLSDLAAHAFPGRRQPPGGSGLTVEWVRAFDEEPPPNHGLSAVEARPAADGAVELVFTASRYGGPPVEVPADLRVDGQRVARVTLALESGSRERRSFTHPFPDGEGPHDVRISLADDALDLDNEVPLPVDLPRPIRVLIVDGAPQPVPFRDEVFYLESALAKEKASQARILLDVIGPEALLPGRLTDVRVVVLANVARVPDEGAKALVDFVKAGGGLFLSMGDQVDVTWSNAALAELLPGLLRGAKGQALLDDASVAEVLGLTRFATGHPALAGLSSGEGGGLTGLSRVQTETVMLLEPQAEAPREVLAYFTNQAPALVERRVEAGRVLLLATTLDRDWSDLAIRPGFLPLMQQVIAYLAGALDGGGPRLLEVGTPRALAVPRGAARIEVHPPGGVKPVVITGEELRGSEQELRVRVPFTATDRPGVYQVFIQREGGDLRELVAERFTVLIPQTESDLASADEQLLDAATPSGAHRRGGNPDDDVEIWPWLLAAAVALLLGESLILRRRGTL